MGFADLHIHTTYSWDGTCSVAGVLRRAREVGLDVIAITDHDEIRGALEAVEMASSYKIGVIPGCEISTADGHLLALFIQNKIPKGLSLAETLRRIADQGGIAIAAHPTARGTNSLTPMKITETLQDPLLARILVGIEVLNAGLVHQGSNREAKKLADSLPVAQVGNSDSHLSWTIGSGITEFPGTTVPELLRALENRKTQAIHRTTDIGTLIIFSWISRMVLRRAGWVSGTLGPEAPLTLVRQAAQTVTR